MSHLQSLIARRAATAARPAGAAPVLRTAGVIGAGLMGSGIAHVCARAGLDVVLIDTSAQAAERARAGILAREELAAARGWVARATPGLGGRITPATDVSSLAAADIVIEAVFEDRQVKAEVTRAAEAVMREEAILASNTSTLSISKLAEAAARPARFIGLHFFSPVDRMPLLEIICGRSTSAATLAAALAFAERIGKTPITVNDSHGFYTTRIVIAYIQEANEMLAEGVDPALIEEAALEAGMPLGPLALCDEVALSLMHKINTEARRELGPAYVESAGSRFLARMVEAEGRHGRKAGGGYYDYPQGAPKRFWPGLARIVPRQDPQPQRGSLRDRLLAIQILEAARCLEEGVLRSPVDGDIGALLGWGFPEPLGGPFTHMDRMGLRAFTRGCAELQRFGGRFAPTPLLMEMAGRGARFHDEAA